MYIDIGMQGMLYTSRHLKWNRTIQPPLDKKKQYRLDAWGGTPFIGGRSSSQPSGSVDRLDPSCGGRDLSKSMEYGRICYVTGDSDVHECRFLRRIRESV